MTKHEIYNGLLAITKARQETCKSEAASMGKDNPTERGALQLSAGIYNVAIAAGLISGTDQATDLMSKRFMSLIKQFPNLTVYYYGLPEEEKEIMEVSLYPEMFMRVNFYNTYQTDLAKAEKTGDPQTIFKARIKKEVMDEILDMWRNFRVEHDLFPYAFEKEI